LLEQVETPPSHAFVTLLQLQPGCVGQSDWLVMSLHSLAEPVHSPTLQPQPGCAVQAGDVDRLPQAGNVPEQLPSVAHAQPGSPVQAVDVVLELHGRGFPRQWPEVGAWQPSNVEQNPTPSELQDVGLGVPVHCDPAPPSITLPASPASTLPPELVVPPVPWPPKPVTPPVRGAQHCWEAQIQPAGQSEDDVQPVLRVPPVLIVPPLPVAPPTLGTPPAPVVPPVAVVPPAPPRLPPLPELPAKPPPVPGAPPSALPPIDVGASVEMAASDDEALPLLLQPVPANGSVQPTMINHQGA
jgi:hypothetical protein